MMEVKCFCCGTPVMVEGPLPEDQEIGCNDCERNLDYFANDGYEGVPPNETIH